MDARGTWSVQGEKSDKSESRFKIKVIKKGKRCLADSRNNRGKGEKDTKSGKRKHGGVVKR